MTFNGSELKYFKNQYDKDKSSRNIVPLHEMIDIKKVHDVSVYLVILMLHGQMLAVEVILPLMF